MAQSPSPPPPGKPLQVPFSIPLLPRSTVAQGKVSVLGISTSAQISEMNLLISVVLCRFPGLPVLLPRDPNNIAWHLGLKGKDLDYSNKKENTKLHFLMSIILPSCKAVWGTPTGIPVGIKHSIICSGIYKKNQVKTTGNLFQERAKRWTSYFGLQFRNIIS